MFFVNNRVFRINLYAMVTFHSASDLRGSCIIWGAAHTVGTVGRKILVAYLETGKKSMTYLKDGLNCS